MSTNRVATDEASAASIERVLAVAQVFAGSDADVLRELARASTRRRFVHGETIWRAGETASSLAVIASGLVKICQPGAGGTSSIVGIFGPRETVGALAVLTHGLYPADAFAASERVELVCIERKVLLARVEHDVKLARAMNSALAQHTRALHDKIRIMSAGPVERRLATLLLFLVERFGDELDDGTWIIPVALSRSDLANLVGTTVETTIRAMSRWQKGGLVETTDDGFVLRRHDELRAIAGAEG